MAKGPDVRDESKRIGRPPVSIGEPDGRDRLLTAALEAFPKKGYPGVTVEALVDTAGVTPPTLYHHFGTKRGLFVATAEMVYAHVTVEIERMDLDGDPPHMLGSLMDLSRRMVAEHPSYSPMILTALIEAQRDAAIAVDLRPVVRQYRRALDAVAAGIFGSSGHAIRDGARTLMALLSGLALQSVLLESPEDFERTVETMRTLIGADGTSHAAT